MTAFWVTASVSQVLKRGVKVIATITIVATNKGNSISRKTTYRKANYLNIAAMETRKQHMTMIRVGSSNKHKTEGLQGSFQTC